MISASLYLKKLFIPVHEIALSKHAFEDVVMDIYRLNG